MIRKRKHPDYSAEKQKLKIKAKAFFPKKQNYPYYLSLLCLKGLIWIIMGQRVRVTAANVEPIISYTRLQPSALKINSLPRSDSKFSGKSLLFL
jgi:carbonic anhydrase